MRRFPVYRTPAAVIVSLVLVLVASVAVAELAEVWVHMFPVLGSVNAMVVAPDGSIYWLGEQGGKQLMQLFRDDGGRTYTKRVRVGAAAAMATMPDNTGVILGGDVLPEPGGFRVPWIARFRADKGRRTWQTSLDEYESAFVTAIAVSTDGESIYVAGTAFVFDPETGSNFFVARLSAAGDVIWTTLYDLDRWDDVSTIAIDPRRGARVCVGGHSGDFGEAPFLEAMVLCLDPEDGTLLWDDFSGSADGDDIITALTFSPNGKRLFAVGYTYPSDDSIASRDGFFQRYLPRDGNQTRRIVHDLTPGGPDEPNAISLRANGTFYVTSRGCVGPPYVCSAYLLTLDRRGRLTEITNYSVDPDTDTAPEALGLLPGGDPVWSGNAARAWLRRMAQ